MKYLDLTGLREVWANIKSYISSKIPTKTSQLQNDSNYATTSQLPSKTSQLTNDSDFTTNAKLATKQDTISDLASIRSGASKGATAVQPATLKSYAKTSAIPTKTSQLTNDSGYITSTNISNKADKATTLSGYGITDAYTKTQVDKKVSDLVNSAPETLDTLNELASALGNDPNFATTVATQIGTKANDSNVVHKSGNETINGVKTFSSQIKGTIDKSKDYYLSDNTLASANGSLGTVRYYINSGADLDTEIFEHSLWNAHMVVNSIPTLLDSFYYIDQYFYANRTATSNRIQILRGYRNANLHMVRVFNGQTNSWSEWAKFASDSDVVHKSGNETIGGTKTFSNDIRISKTSPFVNAFTSGYIKGQIPTSNIYSGVRFFDDINSGSANSITGGFEIEYNQDGYNKSYISSRNYAGETHKFFTVGLRVPNDDTRTVDFLPSVNGIVNLGTPTNKWKDVYATTFNGNLVGNITGNCSGTAGGVAWTNVSGRPTKLSQFTNDSGYLTSGNVVDRTSNQSINGDKTFNNVIQTNNGLWTKDNICLRIQNIDNNETNPAGEIGSCAIGFTNKDASAWWAYNRYIRTTADGTAYLNLLCHPIKKSDGSYTVGGYINIYNTGFARVNDPLKMDPNATWNNNNIVTANWVRKFFSNSIGNYWSKSATGNQYSHSTFSYLSTIDKATTNTSWSIYRPFRMVDKDNSIELGYIEYGYKSDLAYTRLATHHNNGGWIDFTIHSNGVAYLDNCSELWLVNKKLNSYNTAPSNEVDTQIWFMDKNSNKYATLQTDYYADGTRQFALTHKSLRTNSWIGLNIRTSPTDDVIISQPRFQAQNNLIVQNADPNRFTDIGQGWIEMSAPDYSLIDFKHAGSQDYLARIALNPDNVFYLETINGAPIMANGKNIVRSVNGVNADSNGNVSIQGFSNGVGEIIQGYYVPNGIVQKSGSVYFGTLVQPNQGATLNDFRDINITITNEFHPEAGKIYDYSQIFSTLYLHSYDSEYAVNDSFYCGSSPKVDKWFGGWIKVAGSNLVRNSGKYLCTSVSPYGYAVTLRYNLAMTCEMSSYPGGSSPNYSCKIVSKTVPQNQMTVTAKATFMRVG